MIVRILTEGQYKLSSNYLDQLNEIDNKIVEMVETDNKESFHKDQRPHLLRLHFEWPLK